MVCSENNQKSIEGSRLCETGSAAVDAAQSESEQRSQQSGQRLSPGVTSGNDGVLRWAYEMNMWKNPTLVITIWKVLLLATLVPALLMFFLNLGEGLASATWIFIKIIGLTAGIVTVLMLLAYTGIALIYGGKYCVMFEMDDDSVRHIQMQKQYKKNQVLAMIAALSGGMTGNLPTAAAGFLAGSKQSSVSNFEKVKSITVNKKRHVLYLNENLSYNQVYASPEDFDFVCEHILNRCKKARVTEK